MNSRYRNLLAPLLLVCAAGGCHWPWQKGARRAHPEAQATVTPAADAVPVGRGILLLRPGPNHAYAAGEPVEVIWKTEVGLGAVRMARVDVYPAGRRQPVYHWHCDGPCDRHVVGDAAMGEVWWATPLAQERGTLDPGAYEIRVLLAGDARQAAATAAIVITRNPAAK